MSRIREKATESEAVVRNITKEIQVLDLAKRNLSLGMTTMKRLQMLGPLSFHYIVFSLFILRAVSAVKQLEEQVKENRYSEVAQTLAVRVSLPGEHSRHLNALPRLSNKYRPRSVHTCPYSEYHK